MYLYFVFCIVLFIPHINGNSISTPTAAIKVQSSNTTVEPPPKSLNVTKVTLATEGGSVEPDQPITLPKENHSDLINLEKEIGKTKVKSIVPRKGVKYNPVEDNLNSTKERMDTTVVDTKILDAKSPIIQEAAATKLSTKPNLPSTGLTNDTKENINITTTKPKPESPKKKPLILSAEAIQETDRRVEMAKLKAGTSVKPEVHDQLPLPKVKYEQVSSSSHPGMVMPIVITMLVVPMFAVLGYMALRRGQEAWKNRHYKRMDFLLDGN